MTGKEYGEAREAWRKEVLERGRRHGPCYGEGVESFTPFADQYFEREFEPAGAVNCGQALRVGKMGQAGQVLVLASARNEENVVVPAGGTVTATFLQGDSEAGEFEDVGPTMCQTAPQAGMEAEPCHILARFPLPDFDRPWLMVRLEFSGAVTGGKCDCVLNIVPR